MRRPEPNATRCRRGLTLVEMLVTVALVLLIMVIITSVFRAAATSTSRQKTAMDMEQTLRRVEATFRDDMAGVTARMDASRPASPSEQRGYFEYGENAPADGQGEDGDDYLAFTTKAQAGQLFRGYVVVSRFDVTAPPPGITFQRIPITSDTAEIVYFLRNGNLYRRVFLVVPERKGQLTVGQAAGGSYPAIIANGQIATSPTLAPPYVSWQAMNTISAHPAPAGIVPAAGVQVPVPNSLGDLTNRQMRAFHPRFSDDYVTILPNGTVNLTPDGIPDDLNADGLPDYYPSLYPALYPTRPTTPGPPSGYSLETQAFPYVFLGDYSTHPITAGGFRGSYHYPNTLTNPDGILQPLTNHHPLLTSEGNDNLAIPTTAVPAWWGFPTFQETVAPSWADPVHRLNDPANAQTQFRCLSPGLSASTGLLPPMISGVGFGDGTPLRRNPQPYAANTGLYGTQNGGINLASNAALWSLVGESEDLILTGVRSFDVKGYDPYARGYVDLGYMNFGAVVTPILSTIQGASQIPTYQTLGHEGRMPPLLTTDPDDPNDPNDSYNGDNRLDSAWPAAGYVGDNGTSETTVRLRRVWDSWSTDYAYPPDTPYNNPLAGPLGGGLPAYPGFSAPYPVPLTGIQLHIRITDPRNERVRVLTIRQDFSDKQN